MKATFNTVIALFFTTILLAEGGNKYEKNMVKLLAEKENATTSIELNDVAAKFLELSETNKSEWLPGYYALTCYLRQSVNKALMPDDIDGFLETTVKPLLVDLTNRFPDESEIWVLQSWYNAAYLMIDPQSRGMVYGRKSYDASEHAIELDPKNPRALLMKYQNILGRASFTGEDISGVCTSATETLNKFDDYTIKSDIYPTWGKDQLNSIIARCNY